MKQETINELVESYVNGNISYVKQRVKKMTKAEFISFAEGCRSHGFKLHQIRGLVE